MLDSQETIVVGDVLKKISETYPELNSIRDAIATPVLDNAIVGDSSVPAKEYNVEEIEKLILSRETLPEGVSFKGLLKPFLRIIYGTEKDDLIIGTPFDDLIFAGGGNDIVLALAGNDIILGGDGDDIIFGGPSLATDRDNDTILGGNGNDLIYGGFGSDTIIGGNGRDTVDYRFLNQSITLKPTGVIDKGAVGVDSLFEVEEIIANPNQSNTIDASTATGNAAIDVDLAAGRLTVTGIPGSNLNFSIKNFTNVIGTNNSDRIAGNGDNNKILGGNGDDYIVASGGSDFIDGGLGFDTVDYTNSRQAITLQATGVVQKGNSQTDQLFRVEQIIGSASLLTRSVNTIDASTASGGVSIEVDLSQNSLKVAGTPVGDLKFIVQNFSKVIGTSQNDRIIGNTGNNELIGGAGNDEIFAGGGNDTLNGVNSDSRRPGFGEVDVLTGGSGVDLFVLGDRNQAYYQGNGSNDFAIVNKFESGIDKIQLSGSINNYFFLGNTSIFRTPAFIAPTDEKINIAAFDLVGIVSDGFKSNDFVFV